MSKLKAISPKDIKATKPKMLIFGKAGVGKTFASIDFPSVYYIDTEGGASQSEYRQKLQKSGGAYFGVEQGALDFDEIIDQIKALATEKHSFKTVVIDSVSKIFNITVSDEAERLGDKDVFGASKKPAISKMRILIGWLMRLDMNVILISHEKSEWFKGEQIGTTFDCWDKLDYELDLVLNIIRRGGSRVARVIKSRLSQFEDSSTFDWSFESFADKYGKDIIDGKVKSVSLASEDQVSELNSLIELFKVDEDTQAKWFKKAKCETYEDMDSEKIQKIIDMLKSKVKVKGK